jgi:isocitrate lyase
MPQSLTQQLSREQQIAALEKDWAQNPRWKSVKRGYSAADVVRLRGSLQPEYTLAQRGAEVLWDKINGSSKKGYVNAFGAISAGQAMQQAKAGLEAVYLSGWQVAADGNTSETMYPDQSLYAYDSVPTMVRRINNTFKRADEIQWGKGINPGDKEFIDYFLPIVADAEAGFGGVLNAFELMKNMIQAGAAGVHFEDQLAAVKKCGHMGGKVLVPTREAVEKLIAARFAADVMGVPTIVLARTDAEAANLITSNHDANDKPFLTGERTQEGFYRQERSGAIHQPRRGLRSLRRSGVVRNRRARYRLCPRIRPGRARSLPRQAAELQLLAFVQLEEEPQRQPDRFLPGRPVRTGLQVPVHHAGRHPQQLVQHLQVRPRVRSRRRHEALRGNDPGARIRGT